MLVRPSGKLVSAREAQLTAPALGARIGKRGEGVLKSEHEVV